MRNGPEVKHSIPEVIVGYGSWILVSNLLLTLWKRGVFEAVGKHFESLVSITTQILNLLDCTRACIQVKRNLCGFVPACIEVKDAKNGVFLKFGYASSLVPQSIVNTK